MKGSVQKVSGWWKLTPTYTEIGFCWITSEDSNEWVDSLW